MDRPLRFARYCGLLLVALVAACDPWVPESFPVEVTLGAELNAEQRRATLEACEIWNREVGGRALRPVEDNGRLIQRGRIVVQGERPRAGELATSRANHWHCEIAVRGLGDDPSTMVHELGHCLGLEHDHLRQSIMSEYAAPGQRLLPDHIAYVRELMAERLPETDSPEETPSEEAP